MMAIMKHLALSGMATAAAAGEVAKGDAWFSSAGKPPVELPAESRRAFAYGSSHLIEGAGDWHGFLLDLDRDGVDEGILRIAGKGGGWHHLILRKFDGEWEWIGWFDGEFSVVRQADGWLDDIVAVEAKGEPRAKVSTTLKFDGIRYSETLRVEAVRGGWKSTRLAPDPFVPPAPGREIESPLVGRWAGMECQRNGPTSITAITIDKDGTYQKVSVGMVPTEESLETEEGYGVEGADLDGYETGKIDLRTGREILAPAARDASMRSVHWKVVDGVLHWRMDMGTMGGQGVTYSRVE